MALVVRELERVVHGYRAELCVRHRPGVRAQAKERCVLIRQRLRKCRAVSKVSMENLYELRVQDADWPAPNRSHMSNRGVLAFCDPRQRIDMKHVHPRCAFGNR